MSQSMGFSKNRRKTTEACNSCRARKLKCDGMFPCASCEKNKAKCSYDPSTSASRITGDLDIMNARLMELERAVFGERTYQPRKTVELPDVPRATNNSVSGVTFVDEKTGTIDYFGSTSTMNLLKSFHEKIHGISDPVHHDKTDEHPSKRQRRESNEHPVDIYRSSRPKVQDIYNSDSPNMRTAMTSYPCAEAIGNDLHALLNVACSAFPIFDEQMLHITFKDYHDGSRDPGDSDWDCFAYSVLAVGALYQANTPESYNRHFSQAQSCLGTFLGVNGLKTVQAVLLMAIFAHSTAQYSLAYNYLGLAIRLAYSAGLNRDCGRASLSNIQVQEARRTWWTLYSLESDLCLEYGKPICIRETDSTASYPQETMDIGESASRYSFIIVMARFSRIVRKIIDLISNIDENKSAIESFVGRLMNLQAELMTWRGELPAHLASKDTTTSEGIRAREQVAWARQQCREIELRFNHVMIIMHRPFFTNITFSTPFYTSSMARNVCLGAAQDTIISLYQGLMERSLDENLSRYYHRVIAAALVILTLSCDISAEEKTKSLETCSKSIKLFESMKFGCPEKGIALVQSALALLSP